MLISLIRKASLYLLKLYKKMLIVSHSSFGFLWLGTYLAVAVIGAAGVMVPSLPSAIYFLVFVITATYCSLNNPLGRRFG